MERDELPDGRVIRYYSWPDEPGDEPPPASIGPVGTAGAAAEPEGRPYSPETSPLAPQEDADV